MSSAKQPIWNRRQLLEAAGLLALTAPLMRHTAAGGGRAALARALLGALEGQKGLAASSSNRRFLHIFLLGGWDTALATDPIIGAKATSGAYDPALIATPTTSVTGKANLNLGQGLAGAASAFAAIPTAFVNGMYMQITAHPIAQNYAFSGRESTSLSLDYPALAALLGQAGGGFPPHVVLGQTIPLGDTAVSAPPLQATNVEGLTSILTRPGKAGKISDATIAAAEALIGNLDTSRQQAMGATATKSLAPWNTAGGSLLDLYNKNYGALITPTAAVKARYGSNASGDIGDLISGTFLTLQAGLAKYLTINFGGFDTHTDHLARHLPVMQNFATALSALIADLNNTPDPVVPGQSMAANTTILVSSEFVRTPKLNAAAGTDHWQSASAILLGAGIKDNVVVGQTGPDAAAMGWQAGAAVPRTTATQLLVDHLAASVLRSFGLSDAATQISGVNLDALFT